MYTSQTLLKIKKEVSRFKTDNGLGVKDPINTKSLLKKLNVLTVFKPINSDFSGMAIKINNLKFLLVNSNHTTGRQNYTILHELYHLIVQQDFNSSICYSEKPGKKNKDDYNAELFASLALLPEEGILDIIPEKEFSRNRISLITIFEIEQHFMSSREALLNRLKDLSLIDERKYNEYKANVLQNARLYGYDENLYKRGNDNLVIGDYGKLAKTLFDREVISESHFIDLMHDIGVEINFANLSTQ